MPATVTDASALAAVVFDEPSSDEVALRLDSADRLLAPALLWFELANICWKKIRRHPDRREWLLARFERARNLPIDTVEINHRAAVVLAAETGLTAYDASYLWLSRHLDADLVTLDERLRAAAHSEAGP